MKFYAILLLSGLCIISLFNLNKAGELSTTSETTLVEDLEEIRHIIPIKTLARLVIRYLFNDEQFQKIVRIVTSRDGYITYAHFRRQPEVLAFKAWVRTQLLLSHDDLSSMEVSSELKEIFNNAQSWSETVHGWQGFVEEFLLYYPQDLLKAHINLKISQNGVFAQFWQRLKTVKVAYERIITSPEAQRVKVALERSGVDTQALDMFIRQQFDW